MGLGVYPVTNMLEYAQHYRKHTHTHTATHTGGFTQLHGFQHFTPYSRLRLKMLIARTDVNNAFRLWAQRGTGPGAL